MIVVPAPRFAWLVLRSASSFPGLCALVSIRGRCWRSSARGLIEDDGSLNRPSAHRTWNCTVGQTVTVIGNGHVELKLVCQAAIERAVMNNGHRPRRQDA